MKLIYNGSEYYLSSYLNGIKTGIGFIFGLILLISICQFISWYCDCRQDVGLKDTVLGKYFWKIVIAFVIYSLYLPMVWL